jgi:hypothetical protein
MLWAMTCGNKRASMRSSRILGETLRYFEQGVCDVDC